MKKQIILAGIGLCMSCMLYAQPGFEIGGTIGAEFNFVSSFNKEKTENYSALPGVNIGIWLRHNFPKVISLSGGIEYGRMYFSWREPSPAGIPGQSITQSINQFRLPILLQFNAGKGRSQFFANLGPGFFISFPDGPASPNNVYKNAFLPVNIGGMVGMGYARKMDNGWKFFTGARFSIPFFATPAYTTDLDNTTRNLGLSWYIGVSYTPQKKELPSSMQLK